MSHGLASKLTILTQLHHQVVNKKPLRELINNTLEILNTNHLNNDSDMCFPNEIKIVENKREVIKNTRLAWCHGDLGIGVALLGISKKIDLGSWSNWGEQTMQSCSLRKTNENARAVDAGFCHGFSGISLLYHRAYSLTNDTTFKESSQFWYDKVLDNALLEGEEICYKSYVNGEWEEDLSLLTGLAGIGLYIIERMSNHKLSNWSKIFQV